MTASPPVLRAAAVRFTLKLQTTSSPPSASWMTRWPRGMTSDARRYAVPACANAFSANSQACSSVRADDRLAPYLTVPKKRGVGPGTGVGAGVDTGGAVVGTTTVGIAAGTVVAGRAAGSSAAACCAGVITGRGAAASRKGTAFLTAKKTDTTKMSTKIVEMATRFQDTTETPSEEK